MSRELCRQEFDEFEELLDFLRVHERRCSMKHADLEDNPVDEWLIDLTEDYFYIRERAIDEWDFEFVHLCRCELRGLLRGCCLVELFERLSGTASKSLRDVLVREETRRAVGSADAILVPLMDGAL